MDNPLSVSDSEEEEYGNLFLGHCRDDGGDGDCGGGSGGGDDGGSGGGGGGSDFLKCKCKYGI